MILNVSTIWMTIYFENRDFFLLKTDDVDDELQIEENTGDMIKQKQYLRSRSSLQKSLQNVRKSLQAADKSVEMTKVRTSVRLSLQKEQTEGIKLLGIELLPVETNVPDVSDYANDYPIDPSSQTLSDIDSFSYENIYKPRLSQLQGEKRRSTSHSPSHHSRNSKINNAIEYNAESPTHHKRSSFLDEESTYSTYKPHPQLLPSSQEQFHQEKHAETVMASSSAREFLRDYHAKRQVVDIVEDSQALHRKRLQEAKTRRRQERLLEQQQQGQLQQQPQLELQQEYMTNTSQPTGPAPSTGGNRQKKNLRDILNQGGLSTSITKVQKPVSIEMEKLQEEKITLNAEKRRNSLLFNQQQGNYL